MRYDWYPEEIEELYASIPSYCWAHPEEASPKTLEKMELWRKKVDEFMEKERKMLWGF